MATPSAERSSPPHHATAATKPALRGPARSSHRPHKAADDPRKTKNSVYIQPSWLTFQSQLVVKRAAAVPVSGGQTTGFLIPIARDSGSQKTLNPYAIPMHRCTAKAA